MRKVVIVSAVGLAMAGTAFAAGELLGAGSRAELRVINPMTGQLEGPALSMLGKSVENGVRLDMGSAFGSIARGSAGADGPNQSSLMHGFEDMNVLPAAMLNQTTAGTWGGVAATNGVTGRTHVSSAQTAPFSGVTAEAAGGNTTKKVRLFTSTAQPPDGFFTGYRFNFAKTNLGTGAPDVRFLFSANATTPAQLRSEAFVNAITTLFTHEGINVTSGFIIDRVLWGGTNSDPNASLPVGAIPDFYNLGLDPNSFTTGLFVALVFPAGHPNAGSNMNVPVNAWFDVVHEARLDGNVGVKINYRDGNGDVLGYVAPGITAPRFDRFGANSSFEGANDAYYVDNLQVTGEEFVLPTPPPLECTNGMYLDNIEWLNGGSLFGQGTRWIDRLSAKAVVIVDGAQNKTIRQANVFPDDRYRQENRTVVPVTFATPGNPFSMCTLVKIPAGNVTVRGLNPISLTDGNIVSRLYIGREAPPAPFTSASFVQINDAYDPVDPEGTTTPFDNVAVVGTDIAATGFNWPFDNTYRNVCFNVTSAQALTVTVGAATIYTGTAFVNSIDAYWYESENNAFGAGNTMSWDDVKIQCAALPQVTLPPFTLVYLDDLEWGIEGVTIGVMDDDNNTTTPFRWSSAASMRIQQGAGSNTTKVLRMENLFRDTDPLVPSDPNFALFTQATTRLPNVTASGTRGWATSGQYMLTDGATTRVWSPGQATQFSTTFGLGVRLAFSSVTQTLWYSTPNPAFVCPVVTGGPAANVWMDSGTSLSSLGVNFGSFYQLSIHKNLAGNHTFRINGRLLRDSGGAVIMPGSLSSCDGSTVVVNKNLDIIFMSGGDENTATAGSILYADNIKAWALPCLGDTNDDGIVNFTDLNNVLSFFGQSGANVGGNVAPDANGDGVPDDNATNFTDLNAVLSGFGVPCV